MQMAEQIVIVYLKDNCFLPDSLVVPCNTIICFQNEDSILHSFLCKGHPSLPTWFAPSGKSATHKFLSPGKFKVTSEVYGQMMLIIEVRENDFTIKKEKPLAFAAMAKPIRAPGPTSQSVTRTQRAGKYVPSGDATDIAMSVEDEVLPMGISDGMSRPHPNQDAEYVGDSSAIRERIWSIQEPRLQGPSQAASASPTPFLGKKLFIPHRWLDRLQQQYHDDEIDPEEGSIAADMLAYDSHKSSEAIRSGKSVGQLGMRSNHLELLTKRHRKSNKPTTRGYRSLEAVTLDTGAQLVQAEEGDSRGPTCNTLDHVRKVVKKRLRTRRTSLSSEKLSIQNEYETGSLNAAIRDVPTETVMSGDEADMSGKDSMISESSESLSEPTSVSDDSFESEGDSISNSVSLEGQISSVHQLTQKELRSRLNRSLSATAKQIAPATILMVAGSSALSYRSPLKRSPGNNSLGKRSPSPSIVSTMAHGSIAKYAPVVHVVRIEDYEFGLRHLTIKANDIVEFQLADSVPRHAEHLLYAFVVTDNMTAGPVVFESPLLQKGDISTYRMHCTEVGRLKISCRIYPDMSCIVNIVANKAVAATLFASQGSIVSTAASLANSPSSVKASESPAVTPNGSHPLYNGHISSNASPCSRSGSAARAVAAADLSIEFNSEDSDETLPSDDNQEIGGYVSPLAAVAVDPSADDFQCSGSRKTWEDDPIDSASFVDWDRYTNSIPPDEANACLWHHKPSFQTDVVLPTPTEQEGNMEFHICRGLGHIEDVSVPSESDRADATRVPIGDSTSQLVVTGSLFRRRSPGGSGSARRLSPGRTIESKGKREPSLVIPNSPEQRLLQSRQNHVPESDRDRDISISNVSHDAVLPSSPTVFESPEDLMLSLPVDAIIGLGAGYLSNHGSSTYNYSSATSGCGSRSSFYDSDDYLSSSGTSIGSSRPSRQRAVGGLSSSTPSGLLSTNSTTSTALRKAALSYNRMFSSASSPASLDNTSASAAKITAIMSSINSANADKFSRAQLEPETNKIEFISVPNRYLREKVTSDASKVDIGPPKDYFIQVVDDEFLFKPDIITIPAGSRVHFHVSGFSSSAASQLSQPLNLSGSQQSSSSVPSRIPSNATSVSTLPSSLPSSSLSTAASTAASTLHSTHKLSCENEFTEELLHATLRPSFAHTFNHEGRHEIHNEVFSFMKCVVEVMKYPMHEVKEMKDMKEMKEMTESKEESDEGNHFLFNSTSIEELDKEESMLGEGKEVDEEDRRTDGDEGIDWNRVNEENEEDRRFTNDERIKELTSKVSGSVGASGGKDGQKGKSWLDTSPIATLNQDFDEEEYNDSIYDFDNLTTVGGSPTLKEVVKTSPEISKTVESSLNTSKASATEIGAPLLFGSFALPNSSVPAVVGNQIHKPTLSQSRYVTTTTTTTTTTMTTTVAPRGYYAGLTQLVGAATTTTVNATARPIVASPAREDVEMRTFSSDAISNSSATAGVQRWSSSLVGRDGLLANYQSNRESSDENDENDPRIHGKGASELDISTTSEAGKSKKKKNKKKKKKKKKKSATVGTDDTNQQIAAADEYEDDFEEDEDISETAPLLGTHRTNSSSLDEPTPAISVIAESTPDNLSVVEAAVPSQSPVKTTGDSPLIAPGEEVTAESVAEDDMTPELITESASTDQQVPIDTGDPLVDHSAVTHNGTPAKSKRNRNKKKKHGLSELSEDTMAPVISVQMTENQGKQAVFDDHQTNIISAPVAIEPYISPAIELAATSAAELNVKPVRDLEQDSLRVMEEYLQSRWDTLMLQFSESATDVITRNTEVPIVFVDCKSLSLSVVSSSDATTSTPTKDASSISSQSTPPRKPQRQENNQGQQTPRTQPPKSTPNKTPRKQNKK